MATVPLPVMAEVAAAGLTVTEPAPEVLWLAVLFPRYVAVILVCAPATRVETGSVATPPDKGAVPSEVALSKNCTLSPLLPPVTVAVRLTVVPRHTELGVIGLRTVVVVFPPELTWSRPLPVKAAFLWSAAEANAPQVPWAIEVAPKKRALMV